MPLAKHLVSQMLTRDPALRIKGPDILNHPWMKQFECGGTAQDLPRDITASLRLFGSMQLFTRLAHQAASVSLNPGEVTALRKAFLAMDRDDSGGITLDEFRHAMAGKLSDSTVDAIFDKIDVNKSGDISYSEFLTASTAANASQSKSAMMAAFDRMDADGSGFLETAELAQLLVRGVAWRVRACMACVPACLRACVPACACGCDVGGSSFFVRVFSPGRLFAVVVFCLPLASNYTTTSNPSFFSGA
jgi:Ca2+-binding EF-hand superfamily protein